MWWTLMIAAALAGDGPWTLSPRDQSVFLGVDQVRYSTFDAGNDQRIDLASAVLDSVVTPIWTIGIRSGLEVELRLPVERVRVLDPEACQATAPIEGWCKTSQGVGDVEARMKVRVFDELYGSPVSVSVNAGFRSGEAYAEDRARLSTLGDGQTDLGAGLSIGRTDVLGRGWYRLTADGRYWRRLDGASRNLADEVSGSFSASFTVAPSFSIGPAAAGYMRLGGGSISAADFTDPDVWSHIATRQLQVGGKVGLYAQGKGPTLSVTVLRTVLAQNNPTDMMVYSVGLGWFFRARPVAAEE